MITNLTFIGWGILCTLVLFILIKVDLYRVKLQTHKDVEIEKIKIEALKIERERFILIQNGALEEFPNISKYLLQSTYLIDKGNASLSNIELQQANANDAFFNSFLNEVVDAPEPIIKVAFKQAIVNNYLASIKYPWKYRINRAKKNIQLHISRLFVKLENNGKDNKNNKQKPPPKDLEVEFGNSDIISSPC